ncbi:MAG TPA: class I SAM-dependent RNA methyltransferase [Stellaceae bacterium]|nr:class I SAM-dependent RNA methyltransferase [Stellaceae bacterium]
MTEVELTVDSVGVRGDGIASHDGGKIFLPFTAPGDRVRARIGAKQGGGRSGAVVAVLAPGARAQPICRHFGDCGGCALQHLSPEAYEAAKLSWLSGALAQQGFKDFDIAPLQRLAPGTRRRARFALARGQAGFHARASHRIVDMQECAVLHPTLFKLAEPLRRLAKEILIPDQEGAATLTLADAGVALLLDLPVAPKLAALEVLAAFAEAQDLARISYRVKDEPPVPVAQRRPARVVLAGVTVDLPEEAFLQASAEADMVLSNAVLGMVGVSVRVADLYAGLGTFTFALAKKSVVHAIEGDEDSVKALKHAASRAKLADRVTVEQRDLARRPLTPQELDRFDAVVFDPPRAGAMAQSRELAASKVHVVVAISCNPATFARDARILVDGGYRMGRVLPVDSFIWSAQLELVAAFSKP